MKNLMKKVLLDFRLDIKHGFEVIAEKCQISRQMSCLGGETQVARAENFYHIFLGPAPNTF